MLRCCAHVRVAADLAQSELCWIIAALHIQQKQLKMLLLRMISAGAPNVDVVFVHGIRGGPFASWVHLERQSSQPIRHLTHTDCWPSAWLAADVPGARLLSLEYAGVVQDCSLLWLAAILRVLPCAWHALRCISCRPTSLLLTAVTF